MSIQWSTTSREAVSHGGKVMVYGGAGGGKTVLCATAPRPCIISAESGLLSLSRRNLERLYGVGNPNVSYEIPVMQVKTLAQLTEAYMFFSRDPAARQHFATICLDSLSEIAEVVLSNAKSGAKDPRQAYGEMTDKVVQLVKDFRDLAGFHVYMSAKMEMVDTGHGVMKFGPSFPGKQLPKDLPYLFDEVFHLGVGQGAKPDQTYRYLLTDTNMQYTAKDRSGVLDTLEPPDLTHVFNKLKGA
jgi:hypothetical protein